jgi:hypothetical protein
LPESTLGGEQEGGRMSALDRQEGGDHYQVNEIQPIEYIYKNEMGFLEGCIIKRISRHDKDGGKGLEDLKKIIHEVELLMELEYGHNN